MGYQMLASLEQPVGAGDHGHRDAAGQPALDAGRYRIGVDRQPGAQLLGCNCQPFDVAPLRRHLTVLWDEPAPSLRAREEAPPGTSRQPARDSTAPSTLTDMLSHQAREQQRESEGEDQRPRCRRGHVDPSRPLWCLLPCLFLSAR